METAMSDLRTVTQADVTQAVASLYELFSDLGNFIDWDYIAEDVRTQFTNMRVKDIVDPIYDLDGMITNAIEEFV
jgi:hypothetical protein